MSVVVEAWSRWHADQGERVVAAGAPGISVGCGNGWKLKHACVFAPGPVQVTVAESTMNCAYGALFGTTAICQPLTSIELWAGFCGIPGPALP